MIREQAFAKLNLSLNLIPRPGVNNFYPVRFINCELDLHDVLLFKKTEDEIKIVWKKGEPISQENDLIYRAATLLKEEFGKKNLGCIIHVYKKIPVKAGLAGGSSDAAATLKGLVKLWKLNISEKKLLSLAEKLGKDVYFCLKGGLCEVTGYGEKVKRLPYKSPKLQTIVITPKTGKPSTGWMYKKLDKKMIGQNLNKINKLKKALASHNQQEILNNLSNDFENLTILHFPEIAAVKTRLIELGATKTLLAGSGPSVIGFFETKTKVKIALKKINGEYRAVSSARIN